MAAAKTRSPTVRPNRFIQAQPCSPADDEPAAQNAPPVASEREDVFDQKSGGGGYNTSSAPAADPMAEVDRKLAQLPLGNIAFNTPDTIGMDENATIELLVSLQQAKTHFAKPSAAPATLRRPASKSPTAWKPVSAA